MPCNDYYNTPSSYNDGPIRKSIGELEEELCNLRGFIVALVNESVIVIKDDNVKSDFTKILDKVRRDQIKHRKQDLDIAKGLKRTELKGLKDQLDHFNRSGQLLPVKVVEEYNEKLKELQLLDSLKTDDEILSKKHF